MNTTIQDLRLKRITELEAEIVLLRTNQQGLLNQMDRIPDSLPWPAFNKRLNIAEAQGNKLDERIEDLERRRDAILAASDAETPLTRQTPTA